MGPDLGAMTEFIPDCVAAPRTQIFNSLSDRGEASGFSGTPSGSYCEFARTICNYIVEFVLLLPLQSPPASPFARRSGLFATFDANRDAFSRILTTFRARIR
jgi:hypothetical protein